MNGFFVGSVVAAALIPLVVAPSRSPVKLSRIRGLYTLPILRGITAAIRRFLRAAPDLLGKTTLGPDELPAMLDVVSLGLAAGLSFDSSIQLFCERCPGMLAEHISDAQLSWSVGVHTREQALAELGKQLSLPALIQVGRVVSEALSYGTPLAQTLEHHAQGLREERRHRVEEEIERLPVRMLMPLGTLVVPAMFLAILGPLMGSAVVVV